MTRTALPAGWQTGFSRRVKGPPLPDRRVLDGPGGARVVCMKAADGWRYLAYGADRSAGWDYRRWASGEIPHWSGEEPKAHYARGETIPPDREYVGRFEEVATACRAAEAFALTKGSGHG